MISSPHGHSDIVRLLLQNGAAVDAHENNGRTPLIFASRRGHVDIVRSLLQGGAAADSSDNDNWASLMVAPFDAVTDTLMLFASYSRVCNYRLL
jgi:ankyrin repeat protein